MEGIVNRYNRVILGRYNEDEDFVLYKKAQFVSFLALVVGFSMFIVLVVALFLSHDLLMRSYKLALTFMAACSVTVALTVSGRIMWAANFLALSSLFMEILGMNLRPPHLAGVTFGYFFYQTVVFATLFCSRGISLSVLLLVLGTHVFYYFTVSARIPEGILVETGRMTILIGSITIITVYLISLAIASFLNRAIEKSKEESARNLQQYRNIRELMGTIREASEKLGKSIEDTMSEIVTLSDNAQNQAAAMEELSATMEEISAGTTNVAYAAREQSDSINDLVSSIDRISGLISELEEGGNQISVTFLELMNKAAEGEKSTTRLDEINGMISANSGEIQTVVNIMTDFFDRINLLSLNAAIEAARAGEHGRGFAVVASEIGKLADNSAREASQISKLIEKNRTDVDSGNKVITEIIGFIRSLVTDINGMRGMAVGVLKGIKSQKTMNDDMNAKTQVVKKKTEMISLAMREQESAIENVVITIENTSGSIQAMAGSTENLREGSNGLRQLAEDLGRRFTSG